MPAGFHQSFIKVQATMDDSTQHQHYGYHQNIMQANQEIGQQPQTFNPMDHFWFANLSPPSSEEEQQRQTGDESLSYSSAGTLLPSPAQSLSSSSAISSAGTLLPSPADLDIGTSATSLLQTWVDAFGCDCTYWPKHKGVPARSKLESAASKPRPEGWRGEDVSKPSLVTRVYWPVSGMQSELRATMRSYYRGRIKSVLRYKVWENGWWSLTLILEI